MFEIQVLVALFCVFHHAKSSSLQAHRIARARQGKFKTAEAAPQQLRNEEGEASRHGQDLYDFSSSKRASFRDGGQCFDEILSSPPSNETGAEISIIHGVLFSLENTRDEPVAVSSLSVYTKRIVSPVNFSLYFLDDPYVKTDEDGNITSVAAGAQLDGSEGWREIGSGTLGQKMDSHGAMILTFSSIPGSVVFRPGDIKSFYVALEENCLMVETVDQSLGETEDFNAVVSQKYDGLKLLVGRGVILEPWPDVLHNNLFSLFYSPRRFLGNVWTDIGSCAPTLLPTFLPSSSPPSISLSTSEFTNLPSANPTEPPTHSPSSSPIEFDTVLVRGNEIPLDFSAGRRTISTMPRPKRVEINHINGKSSGVRLLQQQDCFNQNIVYPILEKSLTEHITSTYRTKSLGTVRMLDVRLTVSNHLDTSPVIGQCRQITFIYDQEMDFHIEQGDETTVIEQLLFPFRTAADREKFAQILLENDASDGDGFFSTLSGVGEIRITATDLSTRTPTDQPSISFHPSMLPSESPTDIPSFVPSVSLVPTVSSLPTSSPSLPPTSTVEPSTSAEPTSQPSVVPTLTSEPTSTPSFQPTISPSVSQQPTSTPSSTPSKFPSSFPSSAPSNSPTTTLHYNDIIYIFDILYPPAAEGQLENYVIGNVTESFESFFMNTTDDLYPLVQTYQLGFSAVGEPFLNISSSTKVALCEEHESPQNVDNICRRISLTMPFQHTRDVTTNDIRYWLLQASNRIEGDLSLTYVGNQTVRSKQIVSFNNATGSPDNKGSEKLICTQLTKAVVNDSFFQNITLLDDRCENFEFSPYGGGNRVLRRWLQTDQFGVLSVEYTITGEYRPPPGEEDPYKDDFGKMVEDSINRKGEDIVKSLVERGLQILNGSTVEAREVKEIKEPPNPPIVPNPVRKPSPSSSNGSSNFASGPTGIAVIVTCFVVLFAAGFLLYRGLQRVKVAETSPELDDNSLGERNGTANTNERIEAGSHYSNNNGFDRDERAPDIEGYADATSERNQQNSIQGFWPSSNYAGGQNHRRESAPEILRSSGATASGRNVRNSSQGFWPSRDYTVDQNNNAMRSQNRGPSASSLRNSLPTSRTGLEDFDRKLQRAQVNNDNNENNVARQLDTSAPRISNSQGLPDASTRKLRVTNETAGGNISKKGEERASQSTTSSLGTRSSFSQQKNIAQKKLESGSKGGGEAVTRVSRSPGFSNSRNRTNAFEEKRRRESFGGISRRNSTHTLRSDSGDLDKKLQRKLACNNGHESNHGAHHQISRIYSQHEEKRRKKSFRGMSRQSSEPSLSSLGNSLSTSRSSSNGSAKKLLSIQIGNDIQDSSMSQSPPDGRVSKRISLSTIDSSLLSPIKNPQSQESGIGMNSLNERIRINSHQERENSSGATEMMALSSDVDIQNATISSDEQLDDTDATMREKIDENEQEF